MFYILLKRIVLKALPNAGCESGLIDCPLTSGLPKAVPLGFEDICPS
jgi:hypothetical protein